MKVGKFYVLHLFVADRMSTKMTRDDVVRNLEVLGKYFVSQTDLILINASSVIINYFALDVDKVECLLPSGITVMDTNFDYKVIDDFPVEFTERKVYWRTFNGVLDVYTIRYIDLLCSLAVSFNDTDSWRFCIQNLVNTFRNCDDQEVFYETLFDFGWRDKVDAKAMSFILKCLR